MIHPIPIEALDDRIGIVGTTGSGKTYNAGSAIERLLGSGARAIIPDPLGVWWGLRLMADGKTPSPYNVVIFGGPHGDLPINEHVGALIGETVAGMAESAIIDLSEIGSKAAERRFMLAFLTALYKHASGEPVHIVFDEADMWAPQRLMDKEGAAAKLLGQMETIVRRGRIKGFIPWLITQRPAVLSKDVLSQVEGLISFKLTSSQDRDAIGAWVEGQADRLEWKKIRAELPTLQRGTGVIWMPGRDILKTAPFPLKKTFDSSRTPKRGETKQTAKLVQLDITSLKQRLSQVEDDAKANDPTTLRVEIAQLKKQLSKTATVDPVEIDRVRKEGFMDGAKQERAKVTNAMLEGIKTADSAIAMLKQTVTDIADSSDVIIVPSHLRPSNNLPAPPMAQVQNCERVGTNGTLKKAERLILTALAQYPAGRSKRQVAILTGYAHKGGSFNNAIGAMRSKGYLIGNKEQLEITHDGLGELGDFNPLPTGYELQQHWLGQLKRAERLSLEVIIAAYPNQLSKEDVALQTGYEPKGGSFNNALSKLRTLELISGSRELTANDELFG